MATMLVYLQPSSFVAIQLMTMQITAAIKSVAPSLLDVAGLFLVAVLWSANYEEVVACNYFLERYVC